MAVRAYSIAALVVLAACGDNTSSASPDAPPVDGPPDAEVPTWPFDLPPGFPIPRLPPGGRMTPELAELGRYLFYDVRLSGNGTQACASCHQQAKAFTDGLPRGVGSTGEVNRHNSMSLTNVAYGATQTWANNVLVTLEQQALVPMFGDAPVELGITNHEDEVLQRFRDDTDDYPALFAAAFPGEADPINFDNIVRAIAAFERRLISAGSPYDRYTRGELTAISDSAKRGLDLFFSERLECHHCHNGFDLSIAVDHVGLASPGVAFLNDGLYNVGGTGDYPAGDQGIFDLTGTPADRGRFKPVTLRNIALTAPYMHDGSIATLDELVDHYQRGGRLIATGPNAGDGALNPNKSEFITGFTLTAQERADVLAFLNSLTDDTFVSDPTLSDPFQ